MTSEFDETVHLLEAYKYPEQRAVLDPETQQRIRELQIQELIREYFPKKFQHAQAEFPLDKTRSWYLWGPVGVGKTYLAYALVRTFIIRHVNMDLHTPIMQVFSWPTVVMAYKNALFEEKAGYVEQMQRAFLILDDLGAEYVNDQSLEFLWMVLNHRVEQDLWTGITSNVPIGKLPYDDRIKSRISGLVGDNKYELTGKDRRL